jgi:hypothetical protein
MKTCEDVESEEGSTETRQGDEVGECATIDGNETIEGGGTIDDDDDNTRDVDETREATEAGGVDRTRGGRYSRCRGVVPGVDSLEIGSDASQSWNRGPVIFGDMNSEFRRDVSVVSSLGRPISRGISPSFG